MMDLDSHSSDEEHDLETSELEKKVLTYMHLTELDQFKTKYVNKYSHNNYFFKNFMESSSIKTMDYIKEVDEDIEKNRVPDEFKNPNHTPESLWLKISDKLDYYNNSGDIVQSVLTYTEILNTHVRHCISLNVRLFDALIMCETPRHIQEIFDLKLIEPEDKMFINHLFDSDSKLRNPKFVYKLVQSDFFTNLLDSYTVLFYKYPIAKENKSTTLQCLINIAKIINSEKYKRRYDSGLVEKAFHKLVKSAVLNGLFNNIQLNDFLMMRTWVDPTRIHSDSDNDSDEYDLDTSDDDSNMDDSDEDFDDFDERRIVHNVNPPRRIIFNFDNPNNRGNNLKKTIGERINFKFVLANPQSLKKLARIAVKNSMNDYCQKDINRLKLPVTLKDYLSFKEEINEIKLW